MMCSSVLVEVCCLILSLLPSAGGAGMVPSFIRAAAPPRVSGLCGGRKAKGVAQTARRARMRPMSLHVDWGQHNSRDPEILQIEGSGEPQMSRICSRNNDALDGPRTRHCSGLGPATDWARSACRTAAAC